MEPNLLHLFSDKDRQEFYTEASEISAFIIDTSTEGIVEWISEERERSEIETGEARRPDEVPLYLDLTLPGLGLLDIEAISNFLPERGPIIEFGASIHGFEQEEMGYEIADKAEEIAGALSENYSVSIELNKRWQTKLRITTKDSREFALVLGYRSESEERELSEYAAKYGSIWQVSRNNRMNLSSLNTLGSEEKFNIDLDNFLSTLKDVIAAIYKVMGIQAQ